MSKSVSANLRAKISNEKSIRNTPRTSYPNMKTRLGQYKRGSGVATEYRERLTNLNSILLNDLNSLNLGGIGSYRKC